MTENDQKTNFNPKRTRLDRGEKRMKTYLKYFKASKCRRMHSEFSFGEEKLSSGKETMFAM